MRTRCLHFRRLAALAAVLLGLVVAAPAAPAVALSCADPYRPSAYDALARSTDNVYVGRIVDRGTPSTAAENGRSAPGRRYGVEVTRVLKGRVPARSTVFIEDATRIAGAELADVRPGPVFVAASPTGFARALCGPTTQIDVESTAGRYQQALSARGVPAGVLVRPAGETPPTPVASTATRRSARKSHGRLLVAAAASAFGLIGATALLSRRRRR